MSNLLVAKYSILHTKNSAFNTADVINSVKNVQQFIAPSPSFQETEMFTTLTASNTITAQYGWHRQTELFATLITAESVKLTCNKVWHPPLSAD